MFVLKSVAQHLSRHRSVRRNHSLNADSQYIINISLARGKGVLISAFCAALLIALRDLQQEGSFQSNMILNCLLPIL